MKLLTYDDWKLAGFNVKKGESAKSFNKNWKALFSREQVEHSKAFDARKDEQE